MAETVKSDRTAEVSFCHTALTFFYNTTNSKRFSAFKMFTQGWVLGPPVRMPLPYIGVPGVLILGS